MRVRSPPAGPASRLLALFLSAAAAPWAVAGGAPADGRPAIQILPNDRLLVLAPHPDDEVIATGGVILEAVRRGIPVRVVFYTYGDNNEWSFAAYRGHPVLAPGAVRQMGLIRHDEALSADTVLGLSSNQLAFLGYPDFGTLRIWNEHWGSRPPFRSMLTKVEAVPYGNALRPGAAYKGEEILEDLERVFREFKPTKVFVSHAGDHNPDHRSLYLFTRVALWDLQDELKPELCPYLVHYRNWPLPRGFVPGDPLPPPDLFKDSVDWRIRPASEAEIEVKHAAIRRHASQYAVSGAYLDSFLRSNELFGDFPERPLYSAEGQGAAGEDESEAHDIPAELTDEEQAAYIGIERRAMWMEEGNAVLRVSISKPLARAVEFSADLFGYRRDKAFAEMPKIHVRMGVERTWVLDQDRPIPRAAVRIERSARQITIRIPLATLGDPERILTSARTSLGEVPLDWVSWRVLDVGRSTPPR